MSFLGNVVTSFQKWASDQINSILLRLTSVEQRQTTEVKTLTGLSSVTFTLPAGCARATFYHTNVVANAVASKLYRVGTGAGTLESGYTGCVVTVSSGPSVSAVTNATGLDVAASQIADVATGVCVVQCDGAFASLALTQSISNANWVQQGTSKVAASAITTVRFLVTSGTFTSGIVRAIYEV